MQHTNLRLKIFSQTHWSAWHDAYYDVENDWCTTIKALYFIAGSNDEKPSTQSEAIRSKQKLQHLETVTLVIV